MSSLVKNQIVKQLARFTKNLSPNKISVKFLKGEGELHNLELDETTLSELLELPPWIRLTKAVCNRISAKIHWTRLKTDPICLYLDCVEISMEATDADGSPQTRPPSSPHQQPKEKAPNRYGFVEKVVDGMYVQINSAVISFKFQAFLATFQMSRLLIRSTTPKWETDDLRLTRVKDETRGEVLTFKEITWSTLRIDANALYNDKLASQQSTPLRLITSHSALHITIKKRLEDCAVLSARLELLLDDILWVLTQSQLQALTGLLHSVTQAMSRTADMKGTKASVGSPAGQATQQQSNYTTSNVHDKKSDFESLNSLFTQHNVWETSYHLRTGSIDLHLCDDSEQTEGISGKDGGAMHFQINKLSIDYYPYHLAGTSRTDWPSHNEASLTRAYWVGQLLNAFRNSLRSKQPDQRRPSHTHQRTKSDTSCIGADGRYSAQSPPFPISPSLSPRVHPGNTNPSNPDESLQHPQSAHSIKNNMLRPVFMLEKCFVIRCEEFFIKPVSTHDIPLDDTAFLSSDKKALYLPSDMSAFQVDFTQYYYPGSVSSPVPHPNLFVQLNPIQLTLDIETCLWLNRFFHSVLGQRTWTVGPSAQPDSPPSHIDIRIEALMPKISFPCPSDPSLHYKDLRPQALQIQASQVFVTNSRTGYKSSQTDLLMFLQPFMGSKVYTDFARFPSSSGDVRPLPNTAWVNDCSVLPNNFKMEKMMNGMHPDAFGTHQPSQVWCILAEQVWLDFLGIDELKNRPMPFVDAVPLQIWIATPLPDCRPTNKSASSASQSTRGSSQTNTVRHERSASEVIHPKTALERKVFQPLSPPPKNRAGTVAAFLSASSSDPNLRRTTSQEDHTGRSPNSPPPVYEPHINGPHRLEPALSGPPPFYDTLSHNGSHLSGVACEGTSAQNDLNGLSGAETQSCVDVEPGPKANVSFLINIPEHVNVLLDHFQFVFLMRLQEMLVKLRDELEKDENVHETNDSLQGSYSESVPAVFFSVVTQGVNVSVALPPAPDNDASRLDSHASQSTSRNASSLSSYVDTGAVSDGGCNSPEIVESKGNCKTELEDGVGTDKIPLSVNRNPKTNQAVPPSDEHGRPCSSQSASHASGRASAVSATDSDGWLLVATGDSKTGATSVPSRPGSTASNISSQLESSSTKESTNKDAGKSTSEARTVSIFSIEGDAVDIGIHLNGRDQVIKIVCPEVRIEELGVVNFEKYLNRKSFKKSLTKSTLTPSSEVTPMMRIRLEFGPGAERNEPTAGECGFARVKVHGLGGTLLMSSLESLSECFEDEVVLPSMPFIMEVENSAVTINNDNPPRLMSAPLAIPIDLTIDNVSIQRTHDGVFHITPTTPNQRIQDEEREPVTIAMTRQESINASQLSLSDSASISSRTESLENEKQCLVAQMSVSRAALHSLQEERDALLKTIERLQQELSFSNREQDRLQEKMMIYQKGGRKTYR